MTEERLDELHAELLARIEGMLERAELVGGTLSVTSTPGTGTTVVLEVERG